MLLTACANEIYKMPNITYLRRVNLFLVYLTKAMITDGRTVLIFLDQCETTPMNAYTSTDDEISEVQNLFQRIIINTSPQRNKSNISRKLSVATWLSNVKSSKLHSKQSRAVSTISSVWFSSVTALFTGNSPTEPIIRESASRPIIEITVRNSGTVCSAEGIHETWRYYRHKNRLHQIEESRQKLFHSI